VHPKLNWTTLSVYPKLNWTTSLCSAVTQIPPPTRNGRQSFPTTHHQTLFLFCISLVLAQRCHPISTTHPLGMADRVSHNPSPTPFPLAFHLCLHSAVTQFPPLGCAPLLPASPWQCTASFPVAFFRAPKGRAEDALGLLVAHFEQDAWMKLVYLWAACPFILGVPINTPLDSSWCTYEQHAPLYLVFLERRPWT
jgi:hypothetical protein